MSINCQYINEDDHFVISHCSASVFCLSEQRQQSIKVHMCCIVCGDMMKQHLVLLAMSDTCSNKKAYTWNVSPGLPFKSTLMSRLDFLLWSSWRRSVILAQQLPNQLSQWSLYLGQDDSIPLLLLIATLMSLLSGCSLQMYILGRKGEVFVLCWDIICCVFILESSHCVNQLSHSLHLSFHQNTDQFIHESNWTFAAIWLRLDFWEAVITRVGRIGDEFTVPSTFDRQKAIRSFWKRRGLLTYTTHKMLGMFDFQ